MCSRSEIYRTFIERREEERRLLESLRGLCIVSAQYEDAMLMLTLVDGDGRLYRFTVDADQEPLWFRLEQVK